jgi:hypothetical protein
MDLKKSKLYYGVIELFDYMAILTPNPPQVKFHVPRPCPNLSSSSSSSQFLVHVHIYLPLHLIQSSQHLNHMPFSQNLPFNNTAPLYHQPLHLMMLHLLHSLYHLDVFPKPTENNLDNFDWVTDL